MSTIRAVFENGVFRPTGPINLPERCLVEFEPRPVDKVSGEDVDAVKGAIYEILSRRYDGGEPDIAERHNEHQP